ncbi:MAG: enoyl-CoA hydratase/isomerase family protein [Sandaracinaceae bacterium]|jgi:enoyl-CoA hydratase/carnithine racemase|nr:enoyl-CoA hydratase/isomerase family protein [Sandaracinaceae bacterium]MBK7777679.1 enoyl-CoA hydratase/isomerase family protein [Sandaracinaceae bacterium]MBK8408666.1 enoyl-CoA hydratase/isomerase family protein [Sandaracinaceae bacterium]MBK8592057.1 enoyl-CoA hydratase/isomerase family protein [Sandaracinaceae bacterium]
MTEPAVLYSRDGHVGVLTLNRPDQRNAMTPELLGDFAVAVERAKADRGARAVVLVGTGSCFSAGADLHSSLKTGDPNGLPHERSFAMYAPFLELRNVGVPVIAALQGHAVGGGFGLSLMADIRIANERDKYGANFARLGLHSGMAISFMLPRLVGVSRASELLYTGRLVIGAEAERIGLVSEALPGEQVFPRAMELAGEIALSSPRAVRQMKQTMKTLLGWDVEGAARLEALLQSESLTTADAAEGLAAMREKRAPQFADD